MEKQLNIKQSEKGYRFATDSLLLSNFIKSKKENILLEIGIGCGVISLMLCKKANFRKIYGVEIQKTLYNIARENIEKNGFENNIVLINSDIKKIKKGVLPLFDIIFSNPPYLPQNSGRITLNKEKYVAKHEKSLSLKSLIKNGYKLLKSGGSLYLIYPTRRLSELIFEMKKNKIEPKRLQLIFPKKNSKSKLTLIEGIKNGKNQLSIEKPAILH